MGRCAPSQGRHARCNPLAPWCFGTRGLPQLFPLNSEMARTCEGRVPRCHKLRDRIQGPRGRFETDDGKTRRSQEAQRRECPPPHPARAPFSPPSPLLARERPRLARMIGSRHSGRPRHEPLPKEAKPGDRAALWAPPLAGHVLGRGNALPGDLAGEGREGGTDGRWLANDARRARDAVPSGVGCQKADFSALRAGPAQFMEERTRRPSRWRSAACVAQSR